MILTETETRALDGGNGTALSCVVGRGLCLFMRVDATNVPPKQRRDFVRLAVRRAAPFDDAEFGMASSGNGRMAVWYWSRSRVAEILATAGVPARRANFSPEALHVRTATQDGAELLEVEAGFEGRVWRASELMASRWWPSPPALREWREFTRSGGCGPGEIAALPPTLTPAPTQSAWGARDGFRPGSFDLHGLEAHLPTAVLVLSGMAATVASAQIGGIARSHFDVWRAEQEAERMDEGIKRVLDAREAADRNLAAINGLLALRTSRPVIALVSEATRLLPASGWNIRHWQQPTPDRLELTLTMADADPQQLVAAWEASPMFNDVTADILGRSGEVVIRASITPLEVAP